VPVLLQVSRADHVEDHIDPLTVGEALHFLGEIGLAVVDGAFMKGFKAENLTLTPIMLKRLTITGATLRAQAKEPSVRRFTSSAKSASR
jgi:hypothetical protein